LKLFHLQANLSGIDLDRAYLMLGTFRDRTFPSDVEVTITEETGWKQRGKQGDYFSCASQGSDLKVARSAAKTW